MKVNDFPLQNFCLDPGHSRPGLHKRRHRAPVCMDLLVPCHGWYSFGLEALRNVYTEQYRPINMNVGRGRLNVVCWLEIKGLKIILH